MTNDKQHKYINKIGGNKFNIKVNDELTHSIRKNNKLLSSTRLTGRTGTKSSSNNSRSNGDLAIGHFSGANDHQANLNVISKIMLGQGLILNSAQKPHNKESLESLGNMINKLDAFNNSNSKTDDKLNIMKDNKIAKRNWPDLAQINLVYPIEFSSSVEKSNKISVAKRNNQNAMTSESSNNTNRNSNLKNKSSNLSLQDDQEKKTIKHFNRSGSLSLKEKIVTINQTNGGLSDNNSIMEDIDDDNNYICMEIPSLKNVCAISPKRNIKSAKYLKEKLNWKKKNTIISNNSNSNTNGNFVNNDGILNFSSQYTDQVNKNFNSIINSKQRKQLDTFGILAKKNNKNFPQLISKAETGNYLRPNERPISSTINVQRKVRPMQMSSMKFALNKPIQSNIRPSNQFYIPNMNYNLNSNNKVSFLKEKSIRPFSHIQKMNTMLTRHNKDSKSNYNSYNSNNLNEYSSEISNQQLKLPTTENVPPLKYTSLVNRKNNNDKGINDAMMALEKLNMKYQNNQFSSKNKKISLLALDNYSIIKDSHNENRITTRNNNSNEKDINNNSNSNSCSINRKKAYLTKMAKMDDENFNKIIQIVDKIDNTERRADNEGILKKNVVHYTQTNSIETLVSSPSVDRNITKANNDNFFINYIKTDAINFGNININYNNHYSIENQRQSQTFDGKKAALNSISVRILSNWGHNQQIGLTGIEIYDINDALVPIKEIKVINGNEDNILVLFNSENNTTNEKKMWQCDYSPFQQFAIKLILVYESNKEIESIILWNFNGRELSKGIRDIEVYKDNAIIWKGMIKKGVFNSKEDYSTKILLFGQAQHKIEIEEKEMNLCNSKIQKHSMRQMTIENQYINSVNSARNQLPNYHIDKEFNEYERIIYHTTIMPNKDSNEFNIVNSSDYSGEIIWCRKIRIIFSSNYGHRKYIGLTGIQFLNESNIPINIDQASSIGAMPKDISTYYSDNEDNRIFENVFNGINYTNDDNQMWLTVIKPNEPLPYFELVFNNLMGISCIKIWNYNSPNQLDKGVKTIDLYFDDTINYCPYHETICLHKGTGDCDIDYSQNIIFPIKHNNYTQRELEPFQNIKYASFLYNQCYETPYLPTGFVLKINFISPWEDAILIGLNGIEIYDQLGKQVLHKKSKWQNKYRLVASSPEINYRNNEIGKNKEQIELSQIENIINGKNYDTSENNSWISRFNSFNKLSIENHEYKEDAIYFFFQSPITISYVIFYNYLKEPNQGIKDIQMFLDNDLIFSGQLNKSIKLEGDKWSNETIILFTCDLSITKDLNENMLSKPIKNTPYTIKTNNESTILNYHSD